MTQWHDVAAQDDVFDGAGLAVQVAGHEIAVFQVDGAFYAIDNTCSHGGGHLCARRATRPHLARQAGVKPDLGGCVRFRREFLIKT